MATPQTQLPESNELPPDLLDVPSDEEELTPDDEQVEFVVSEELDKAIKDVVEGYTTDEKPVREGMIRLWKKQMEYWRCNQYLYWDEYDNDWRNPEQLLEEDPDADIDPALFAKVINVYRAHGEIIIAALSNALPQVRFFPNDSDVPEDISTAKAYSRIAELIVRHNSAQLLLVKALFILYNQGVVFAYNEHLASKQYGYRKEPETGTLINRTTSEVCPICGATLSSDTMQMMPDEEMVQPMNALGPVECPGCGQMVEPVQDQQDEPTEGIVGYKDVPKTREVLNVYGPLNVCVPHWIAGGGLKSTPYLRLDTEEHYTSIMAAFPERAHLIQPSFDTAKTDRWARSSTDYRYGVEMGLGTYSRVWLRPSAFWRLGWDNEQARELRDKYKNGIYASFFNDILLEVVEDDLDDHWTVTENPLSDHIHADSIGKTMMPLQDMTNEAANLQLENLEFSIPETWVDTNVVDLDAYKNSKARPGQLYPATARVGMGLDSAFFESRTATLSPGVDQFIAKLEGWAQFVLGSYPTIYGGAMPGGGGTAKEYELSRMAALQRLSITWLMLKAWWGRVLEKSVKSYADNMQEDEKFSKPNGADFITVWIRKADLTGKAGVVSPEVNESLPVSWAQKRDVIMNLMGMKDPTIGAILSHPNNATFVKDIVGLSELFIPGDEDRTKQLMEISKMLQEEPIQIGMGQFMPSVDIDPDVDNHQAEMETCDYFLKSEVGILLKEENPAGWLNIKSHRQAHFMQVQQAMMQQAMMTAAQQPGDENKDVKEPPKASKE